MNCFCLATGQTFHSCRARGLGPSQSANYHPRRHPSHPLASYRPKRPWLSNHPLPPHHLARSPARAPGRRAEICGTCRVAPQRNAGCHSAVEGDGVSCRLGWVGPTPTPTPTLWCVAAAAGGRGCSRSPQAGWRGSQGEGGGGELTDTSQLFQPGAAPSSSPPSPSSSSASSSSSSSSSPSPAC